MDNENICEFCIHCVLIGEKETSICSLSGEKVSDDYSCEAFHKCHVM